MVLRHVPGTGQPVWTGMRAKTQMLQFNVRLQRRLYKEGVIKGHVPFCLFCFRIRVIKACRTLSPSAVAVPRPLTTSPVHVEMDPPQGAPQASHTVYVMDSSADTVYVMGAQPYRSPNLS